MVSVLLCGFATAAGRPPTSGDSVRTLGALVPAAVEGVVRDVQVLAIAPAPELAEVAEHAGCGFVAAPDVRTALAEAVASARSPHLLLLLAGVSFDRSLIDEMAGVEARHGGWIVDGIGIRSVESGLVGRVLPRFAPTIGILATRERVAAARAGTLAALWRGLRPGRSFKTRAWSGA